MAVLPNVPPLALRLVTSPTVLAHRVTGYVPRIYRYPYKGEPPFRHQPAARTTFFDALERHLAHIEQLVILGAGFDTRCYRLQDRNRIRCFEVDGAATQNFKRQMLRRALVDTTGVSYIAADFVKDDWREKLRSAGFQVDLASFFLWEAVTMYLTTEAVDDTLRKIAETAAGSVVAFDYVSSEAIERPSLYLRYSQAVMRAAGERWRFGIDTKPPARQHLRAILRSAGLSLEEQQDIGPQNGRRLPMGGFATAVV
jgi:methyltransferase (TIGR00027 family)